MCAKPKMDPTESAETDHTFKLCPACAFFCSSKEPDSFCSSCGSALMVACPQCKKDIVNPYAKYCKFCGMVYPGRIVGKGSKEF